MLLAPCVIAAIPDKSSMIYTVPAYSIGSEAKTYGSCDTSTLPDNATLCCSIGENLTVTCCAHPNKTEYESALAACASMPHADCHPVSYCISYDLERIEAIKPYIAPSANLTATAIEAGKECAATPETHRIADEALALRRIKKYRVTIDAFDRQFISTTFDLPEEEFFKMKLLLPNGTTAYCAAPKTKIKRVEDLPTLTSIIKELGAKFNIHERKIPSITMVHDKICDQQIQQTKGLIATGTYISFDGRSNIDLCMSFVKVCPIKNKPV